MSAAELGARAGLSEYMIWKAERSEPVMEVNIARIARALGVDLEDIASPPEALASLNAKNGPALTRRAKRDNPHSLTESRRDNEQ